MSCLRGPLKEILGFLKFWPKIINLSFFGQIIKSILQSTNGEGKLINVSQILIKLCNGKIENFA